MKFYTLILLTLCSFLTVTAQAPPEAFNYSGAVKDGSGNPLATQTIGVEFSILESSPSGSIVYREQHSVLTDANGIFNLSIGWGSVQEGTFEDINWGENAHYLKVGIDSTGGTSYTVSGITQLLSVPYAMYAKRAGEVNGGNLKPIVDLFKDFIYEYNDSTLKILLNGFVYSEGSSPVSENGIVWANNTNPTVSDNKINISSGGGSFGGTVDIPISGNEIVHIRPYAINSSGAAYSNNSYKYQLNSFDGTFTVDSVIKENPFNSRIVINYLNSSPNVAHICLDTVPNSRNPINCIRITKSGINELIFSNLNPNTTYYLLPKVAYSGTVVDGNGVTTNNTFYYGNEVIFTTDTIFTDYDGMYVGVLEQNNINTIPNTFVDTMYVTVDHVNLKAIVTSKFFQDVPLEIDLKLISNNILNRTILKGLEYENTTDKPLIIAGAAYSENFIRLDYTKLLINLKTGMYYPPRSTIFDNSFPVHFIGEYIKQ